MNCCLWINGKKVFDLNGIRKNFNITDIRGYYLGGRLADWLYSHNAEYEARLVEAIPKGINPDKNLYDIFCTSYKKPEYHIGGKAAANAFGFACSYGGSYSRALSSAQPTSMKTPLSSFVTTSAKAIAGSARTTSFGSHIHQHEFEFEIGSFVKTSFTLGSFNLSSFKAGSFVYDSFEDNDEPFTKEAALAYFTSEPLNMYGYGIHLI